MSNHEGNVLNIALDLGGDTLKIGFAYQTANGIRYGKFAAKSKLTQVALPALAYYDPAKKEWRYADQIDREGGESFLTVVKIKNLIAMLSKHKDEAVWAKNKNYYFSGHEFPKFYFPARRRASLNFDEMVKEDRTFRVEKHTPQSVCLEFFRYVRAMADTCKEELSRSVGAEFTSYRIALVHPAHVGDEYLAELSNLISQSFHTAPAKTLNSNKALALFARLRGEVEEGEDFLVFDMGEESMSVVHASIMDDQVVIDGAEGHNAPAEIGGNDVDEAIVSYLENLIKNRETIGTPSAGEAGHITENSVYEKQYLLMKDVKKSKVILSKPPARADEGRSVPVTFRRDVMIQRRLSKDDIYKSIGASANKGIAKEILDYVVLEVKKPINRKVKKIFLSGGLVETYSLLDYIRSGLATQKLNVEVRTYGDGHDEGDDFDILSYEGSVYAPAVGGAVVSLLDIDIKTVLSLSYGTWGTLNDGTKCLVIFVNRGAEVEDGKEFMTKEKFKLTKDGVVGEEMFSTVVTDDEIREDLQKGGNWKCATLTKRNGRKSVHLVVGDPGTTTRQKAEWDVDLKVVSGGQNARISFRYGMYPACLPEGEVLEAVEGIRVDKDGRATPFIRNVSAPKYVNVELMDIYRTKVVSRVPVSLNALTVVLEGVNDWETPNQ